MRALSVRQPWAWLLIHGHKPVENRKWATFFRGPVLIHASSAMTEHEYLDARHFVNDIRLPAIKIPALETLARGGVVGMATLTGCVRQHDSLWFTGPIGWVFADAKPLPFFACRGRLGLFEVELPQEVLDAGSN